jgi:hypothetical protein
MTIVGIRSGTDNPRTTLQPDGLADAPAKSTFVCSVLLCLTHQQH